MIPLLILPTTRDVLFSFSAGRALRGRQEGLHHRESHPVAVHHLHRPQVTNSALLISSPD